MAWVSGSNITSGSLNNQGGKIFHVATFGAVADGSTDNATAIQAALNAAGHSSEGSAFEVHLDSGTYSITTGLVVRQNTILCGRGPRNTKIVAGSGFPNATPLVQLGSATSATAHHSTQVRNLELDGSPTLQSIGVYSTTANEQSGVYDCVIKYGGWGIHFSGATVANPTIRDVELFPASSASSTVGIHLNGVNGRNEVESVSIVPSGTLSGTNYGVLCTGIANSQFYIRNVHVEMMTDGVRVQSNGLCSIENVDAASATSNVVYLEDGVHTAVVMGVKNNNSGMSVLANDATTRRIAAANPPSPGGALPLYLFQTTNDAETWVDIFGVHTTRGTLSLSSAQGTLPSAVSGQGYFRVDSGSSLYWVDGSNTATLIV